MNLNVTIDWKFVVALGTAAVGVIFAGKMDGTAAERVSTHAVDACKELAIAGNSDRQFPHMMTLEGTQSSDQVLFNVQERKEDDEQYAE